MDARLKIAAYLCPSELRTLTGVSMLTLNMVRLLGNSSEVQLRLLVPANELVRDEAMPDELGLKGIPIIPLPWSRVIRESLWLGLNAPAIDRYLPADFWVYCSRETFIPARECKRIVTVHHLDPPQDAIQSPTERLTALRRDFRLNRAIRTANIVVAQSRFTKNMIAERFGIPGDRIHVVGSGVDEETLKIGTSNWRPPVSEHEPYVVSAGAFHLRKGTDYLFAMARELSRRGSPLKVICPYGSRGDRRFVEEARTLSNVVVMDYLSREDLVACVRNAVCMVIPSRLEGFGLTAIESMALATPVVASDNSALPETLGHSGILVNPADAVSLANAVEKIFRSPQIRVQMTTSGLKRAQDFTWERCLERLISAIRLMPHRHAVKKVAT